VCGQAGARPDHSKMPSTLPAFWGIERKTVHTYKPVIKGRTTTLHSALQSNRRSLPSIFPPLARTFNGQRRLIAGVRLTIYRLGAGVGARACHFGFPVPGGHGHAHFFVSGRGYFAVQNTPNRALRAEASPCVRAVLSLFPSVPCLRGLGANWLLKAVWLAGAEEPQSRWFKVSGPVRSKYNMRTIPCKKPATPRSSVDKRPGPCLDFVASLTVCDVTTLDVLATVGLFPLPYSCNRWIPRSAASRPK